MRAADVAGWACTVLVLGAYARAALTKRLRAFHAANAVGAVGIGWSAVEHGAWPSLAITAAFGLIGLAGLRRQ